MKFLIDAQLPRRATNWFATVGCDATHTLDLLRGNRTVDAHVLAATERENRILVTKDADFVRTHLLQGRPRKLLLISTGNVTNRELETLLVDRLPALVRAFQSRSFVELTRSSIIVRS